MGWNEARLLLLGLVLAFFSIFQMGYSNAYPNTAIESFRLFLNQSISTEDSYLTEKEFSWIWSAILNVYFIGFIIGSLVAVPLADRMGRKWCLVMGNVSNLLSAILAFISIVYFLPWLLLGSRVLFAASAAISMNSLILLLQESSPSAMRGLMSFSAETAFVVMNLVGALAGMRTILGSDLPLLVGLVCLPTALSVLIALLFHESPKYLLLCRKNTEKATAALYFYQRTSEEETAKTLRQIEKENTEESGTLSDIFTVPHIRKGLILGIVALQITCSIWPIVFYSTEFLARVNIEYEMAEMISTVMLFLSSLCTIGGMSMVERCSRRKLFIGFSLLNILSLCLFVICALLQPIFDAAKNGCIAAVILHGTSYSVAVGPIAWFLTAEMVPQRVRAVCVAVALAANNATAMILSFVTLPLYDTFGSLTFIPLFIIPGLIYICILYFHLPETRDRPIDDVIQDLKGKKKTADSSRVTMDELIQEKGNNVPTDNCTTDYSTTSYNNSPENSTKPTENTIEP